MTINDKNFKEDVLYNEKFLITSKMDYNVALQWAKLCIIHGGAGITSLAIKNLCPLIIRPFNGD